MRDWSEATVGPEVEILSGFAFPSHGFSDEKGIPLVRIRDIGRAVTEIMYCGRYEKQYLICRGDLLIGMDGDFLVEKWRGDNALLNQRVCKLSTKPRGRLDQAYLYYLLEPEIKSIHTRTPQTTVRHLSTKAIKSITVRVPDLPEQQRIAEILDTLDEAIRKTEGVIAKLRQMKQGLLHELLTRGLDDNGELRDPERQPEQFHTTALGRLPKGWDVTTGKEVCREIVVGIVIRPAQYYVENGVPVLRSANVREDGLTLDDLVFMSERSHRALAKSAVGPGDVVTVRTGYPGTTCVIPSDVETANCVDIIISRVGPLVSSKFLAIWVNSDFGRGQVLRQQGGLAQQHFNVGEMKSLKLVRPTIIEQSAIVTRVAAFERRLGNEQIELAKLQKLKSGLMDDLLTGRVRVTKLIEKAA